MKPGIWLENYHIDAFLLLIKYNFQEFSHCLCEPGEYYIKDIIKDFRGGLDLMIQVGGSDCGFFALAYVQSLVQGIEPESCQYNQEKMNHVYNVSITNKTMNTFPYVIKDFQEREIFEIDLSDNYIYTTEENLIYNK